MKGLGLRLRLARKNKGITQLQLAALVHTNQHTISQYEIGSTGKFRPDINLLFRVAKALDVTVGWLLTGED